ncbi:MAG: hypothetical protein ACF8SC_04460 [Phycisphaerales bacterium JB037]
MCGIVRSAVRFGVITVLVGGAAVAIAGPDRIKALIHQARHDINHHLDSQVDDAVALRTKLRNLEQRLPQRIAEVRGDFGQATDQIAQLERELAISQRVVELANADLAQLGDLLARAEGVGRTDGSIVRVRFDEQVLSTRQASAKAASIAKLRDVHQARTEDISHDLSFLRDQQQRLGTLLADLEAEQADLQTQIWQIDRQVDAIERNERLIDTMEKRERAIEKHQRYQSESLDEYRQQLDSIRARQEAKLERLAGDRASRDYENRARAQIGRDGAPTTTIAPRTRVLDADDAHDRDDDLVDFTDNRDSID